MTFPGTLETSSIFASGESFVTLKKVPKTDGTFIDVSCLPILENTENLVQLFNIDGKFVLENEQDSYRITMQWNPESFNSVLLWMSNRGRPYYPWNGTFTAVGIEPVCSAFDLGYVSACESPISNKGVKTTAAFHIDNVWKTAYSIEVSTLGNY